MKIYSGTSEILVWEGYNLDMNYWLLEYCTAGDKEKLLKVANKCSITLDVFSSLQQQVLIRTLNSRCMIERMFTIKAIIATVHYLARHLVTNS